MSKSSGKETIFLQQDEITYFAVKESGRTGKTWTVKGYCLCFASNFFNVNLVLPVR